MTESGPVVVDAREVHDRIMRAVTIMLNDATPKVPQLAQASVDWSSEAGHATIAAAGIIGRLCHSTAKLLTEASPTGNTITAEDVWRACSADEMASYEAIMEVRRRMLEEYNKRQDPAA